MCLAISILILMICTAAMQKSYEAYELLKKDSKDKVNILKHEGSDHIFTTIKTVFSPYLISKLLILCRSSLTHTSGRPGRLENTIVFLSTQSSMSRGGISTFSSKMGNFSFAALFLPTDSFPI